METAGFELDSIYYVLLFFAALFGGFIDTIVGGGGLITIPALLASGVPAHLALATGKLQTIFGLFTASFAYYKSVSIQHLGFGVLCSFIGGALGTYAVLLVSDKHLKLVILACLVLVFAYMVLKPSLGRQKSEPKIHNIKLFHFIVGLTLGFYDGFLGAGPGSFWVFAFVLLLGFDMKNASINMKILNLSSSLAALILFVGRFNGRGANHRRVFRLKTRAENKWAFYKGTFSCGGWRNHLQSGV